MNLQETTASADAQERTIETIDAEIAVLREERAKLVAVRRASFTFGAHDEIPVGEAGRLFTLKGVAIVGTNESVPGTATVLSASRKEDGSLDLNLSETSLCWDGADTTRNDLNELEFVTVKGDIVPESEVMLVPLRWTAK